MTTEVFNFLHHQAGLCTLDQIGTPIPDPDESPIPIELENEPGSQVLPDMSNMTDAEIAQTAVRLLREATVEVFHRLGGQNWLYDLARSDPKNFLRMLQRLLPQSVEASITVVPFEVPASIRGLSVADLTAMRDGVGAGAGKIQDVAFTEVPRPS